MSPTVSSSEKKTLFLCTQSLKATASLVCSFHNYYDLSFYLWIPSGIDQDFESINDTTFVIAPEASQVCLQFIAFDDDVPEGPEEFIVTIEMNGQSIGNTTVVIIDNDGECVGVCSMTLYIFNIA